MRQTLLLIVCLSIVVLCEAQMFKLTGRVTNAARVPVALASVEVKDLRIGTLTKDDGTYSLQLEEGKYDIFFSIVGYKTQVVTLVITRNYVQNIILEPDMSTLEGFTLKSRN